MKKKRKTKTRKATISTDMSLMSKPYSTKIRNAAVKGTRDKMPRAGGVPAVRATRKVKT